MYEFKILICRFRKKTNLFQAVNQNNNFYVVLNSITAEIGRVHSEETTL